MRARSTLVCLVLVACGDGTSDADTGAVTTTLTAGHSATATATSTSTTAGTSTGGGTSDAGDGDGTTMTTSGDGDGTTLSTSGDGDGPTSGDGDGTTAGDGDGTVDDPPRDSLMNEFLADAMDRAAQIDSGLALTQINGFGIDAGGRVGIDGDTGFLRRWNFGFHNPGSGHEISIIYMSETWAGDYPQVEDPAGNVTQTDPIVSPSSLPDSDVLASQYAAAVGCAGLSGDENDNFLIRYEATRGGNVLQFTVGGSSWGADLPSFTEWYGC